MPYHVEAFSADSERELADRIERYIEELRRDEVPREITISYAPSPFVGGVNAIVGFWHGSELAWLHREPPRADG